MPRSLALTVITLLLLTELVPARAAAAYLAFPAFVAQTKEDGDKGEAPAKNAGSIDGQIMNVDYGAGRISVKVGNARYDVVVLPSTSIQGKATDTFHTIADIHKGAHVQVIMSQRAGAYTAQIIRLL